MVFDGCFFSMTGNIHIFERSFAIRLHINRFFTNDFETLTMEKTLTLLFALFCALSLAAQSPTCMRDSIIVGTDSVLWPLPYTPAAPNYNLNEACINHPYNQSVSINVPDSYMGFPVTNVNIATSNAISNLPVGLTYNCDPPNCVFNANTLGCILLYGTPTNANMAPDTLDLGIMTSVSTAFGVAIITLPGQLEPGSHYYLILKTPECLTGSYDFGNQFTLLKNTPNPFGNQTLITAESLVAGDFQFEVFDFFGRRLYEQKLRLEIGHNEFPFDAGELANGAYFYTLGNRDGKASQRMIVAR